MTLLTRWGRELDPENVLPEYPRPQLVRDAWLNLNGLWEYAITPIDAPRPADWEGRILVPFSPEAPLSGVNRILQPNEALWYRRVLDRLPATREGERTLLHVGASDRHTTVWLSETTVGEHHDGFLPFTCELTQALAAGERELVIRVTDPSDTEPGARGKQKLAPGGIWYTPQSGIWQTVWLEAVPERYITELRIEPRYDPQAGTGAFAVTVLTDAPTPNPRSARIIVRAEGREVAAAEVPPGELALLDLAEVRAWSPADPFLYDVEVTFGDDHVTSYAGLRSLGTVTGADGVPRLALNGEPVLQAGLLDQGYWPDGLLTAPSDAALIFDIETAREAGFTMLRKHIKVESARWYAHCDRLGMLVWQDAVNGGGLYHPFGITLPAVSPWPKLDDTRARRLLGRTDAADRLAYEHALERMVRLLGNHPSIVGWVPFNEGWGQFDSVRITEQLRALDASRPIDHASGWHDQGAGDVFSLHVYFRRFRMPHRRRARGRVTVLSEFGGYSLPIDGHRTSTREFGYKRFRDTGAFAEAITRLWRTELAPAVAQGLTGFVYTQLSDVEDEVNGLVSYDREVVKLDPALLRELNDELQTRAARQARGETNE